MKKLVLIPKRMPGSFLATLRYDPKYERSELVHFVGIVPRLSPPVRPLIRMSDSGSRALPWGMIPFIVLIVFVFIPVIHAEDLIPRRILFKSGPDIPAMTTEILFTGITEYHPIVAVDENVFHHNSIDIVMNGDEIRFTLNEDTTVLDTQSYSSSRTDSYDDIFELCRDTALIWSIYLAMVPPTVKEELVDERQRLAEEVDLELRLAKDFQLTLWLPAAIILDFNESDGSSAGKMKFIWPLGAEFHWFLKNNVGITASLIYEYNSADSQTVNRFIPGVGFVFRTLGRFSAEFGLKLNLIIVNISDLSDSTWEIYPTIEIAPMISWNFTDNWSLKTIIFGYVMDPLFMFGTDRIDQRNQLTLLNLGVAYRW